MPPFSSSNDPFGPRPFREEESNPFAAPQTRGDPLPGEIESLGEAELIRTTHINHETSIKQVGCLYYIGAITTAIGSVLVFGAMLDGNGPPLGGWILVYFGIYLGIGGLLFFVGYGLRGLSPIVRIPAAVVAVFGMCWVPFGTILGIYLIWLLISSKGQMVFSPLYKDVIAQTPHIKYRSSWLMIAVVVILITIFVVAVIGYVMNS